MDNNKEYIINFRVSKATYSKLKSRAKENGESLSHIVRKSLEDGWEIFNDLKTDLFNSTRQGNDSVEYFQKVILAADAVCSRCNTSMEKGSQVFLGETKKGEKKYFCNDCFSQH